MTITPIIGHMTFDTIVARLEETLSEVANEVAPISEPQWRRYLRRQLKNQSLPGDTRFLTAKSLGCNHNAGIFAS